VSVDAIYLATVWAIPVIIAITFHEAAHGFVAHLLGDDTAWRLGRVSFNPLKHVDPFGTILLPGILLLLRSPFMFGYAKPVPVDFRALRWPRLGMVLVAVAGPAMNIALAVAAALAFHIIDYLPATSEQWLGENLKNALIINVVLAGCSICFRCHLSMAGAFWSGFSRRLPLHLLRGWSRTGWQS
jgi:Zn-dependent protease